MLEIDAHAGIAGKPILKGFSFIASEDEVLKGLPMDVPAEAQKLLAISLEGSVG